MVNKLDKIVDSLIEESKKHEGMEGIDFTADDALCVLHEIESGADYKDAINTVLQNIKNAMDTAAYDISIPHDDDEYFGCGYLHSTDARMPYDTVETLKKNSAALGMNTLLECVSEECAELIQAIHKYKRANGQGQPTEVTKEIAIANLVEELADVKMCIDAILYVSGYDLVPTLIEKTEKVRRRVNRGKETSNGQN